MPIRVNIAGVLIDKISKPNTLTKIDELIRSGQPHYGVTPYSEIIGFAIQDKKYAEVLNQADLSLPDGIGILWAAKFLSLPGGGLRSLWQIVYTGAAIIFNPKYIRSVITEQITGRELVYDIAQLAAEKNYSLTLVGGRANVAEQSAVELKKIYPGLNIKLAVSSRPFDQAMVSEISQANSDILLVAYSPPRQELWIAQNLQKLNCRFAIGLGGTFDYVAGIKPLAPNFWHYIGIEWLWRLITQPHRLKRIWRAVPVFIWQIYRYKLTQQNGFRS